MGICLLGSVDGTVECSFMSGVLPFVLPGDVGDHQ
jgi:hypothetical protein